MVSAITPVFFIDRRVPPFTAHPLHLFPKQLCHYKTLLLASDNNLQQRYREQL